MASPSVEACGCCKPVQIQLDSWLAFFSFPYNSWLGLKAFFFLFHFLLLLLQHNTSSIWVLTVTAIPWILRSCFYLYLCSLFPSRQNLPFSLCCVYFSLCKVDPIFFLTASAFDFHFFYCPFGQR